MMMQNKSMMGLVRTLMPKLGAPAISARLSTLISSSMIRSPTVPMLVPAPVRPIAKVPCKDTDRA